VYNLKDRSILNMLNKIETSVKAMSFERAGRRYNKYILSECPWDSCDNTSYGKSTVSESTYLCLRCKRGVSNGYSE